MSQRQTPPGVSAAALERAFAAFTRVVGEQWALRSEEDRRTYEDLYAFDAVDQHIPSGAVAPGDVEQVRALVRLANEHRIPLWPISRGKNLGYGGAAPRMAGTVVLDLGRMNRILDVNEKFGYCIVEPGVGFYDLFDHLQRERIQLWMSAPGQTWGSVVGNALDRGNGAPLGEHAERICGLEVVLPDGDLVRTGMGAMSNSDTWAAFKHGYGPSWDFAFTQSNFGVVTKMGLWLMPAPEASLSLRMKLPRAEDAGWAIDALRPLRLQGVISQPAGIGNYLRDAAVRSQRQQWHQGEGAMPDAEVQRMIDTLGIGWWSVRMRFFGPEQVNAAKARVVRDAFAKRTRIEFEEQVWRSGEPLAASGAAIPSVSGLRLANWMGGQGAHSTFSPVLPADGALATAHLARVRARFSEHGFDYYGGFTLGERALIFTSGIIFNRDDAAMKARARALFAALIEDAAAAGYGEYRTHLSFMDRVAQSFDFNEGALRRLNEKVKNALDPRGIIAPGKQGIWPRAYPETRR
ncbi:MAG: FAD-binding oxidoreductase [Hyphomonadaceae bacterium]|nr:FAD-binding oxidoreductase [Hyphomonadaceae bacterium]